MKKRLLILLFLTAAVSLAYAQPKQDSNFVRQLLTQAQKVVVTSDSFEVLSTQALLASEKIGFKKGVLAATDNLASYYFQKGKLSRSLQYLLKNEESAIASGDSVLLFNMLRVQSTIYHKIGDINMVRMAVMRRQAILDNKGIKHLKDTSYEVLSQYNTLAHYYAAKQVNKPDSVEYFYRKMNRLGKNTFQANLWSQLSNGGIGNVFLRKKMYDSAIHYLRMGMSAAQEGNRFDNYNGYVVSLANAFRSSGQLDSSLKYAYVAFEGARKYSLQSIIASSAGELAKSYQLQKQFDSAVKYMTLERDYKDSVSGTEALNSVQFLTNEYQLKSLEKQREKEAAISQYKGTLKNYFFIGGVILLLAIIAAMYRVNKQRARSKQQIEKAYQDLKATQLQLIQAEKMASLGELTAGIAHEIQNPLNFVNNFSELSRELLEELKVERGKLTIEEQDEILKDVGANLEKINHHGKRADAIVKGMLQHSQSSSGVKQPTNINELCDEYLRLSYHGLRAKDKSFNATLQTDFDSSVGMVDIVPQDIGRVLLNIIGNAFLSVQSKQASLAGGVYQPTVKLETKRVDQKICITVRDNGTGIPANIQAKIFQPFFTTRPTGQGTGLGLSLSYDIIKAHQGDLNIESEEGEYAKFIITLPV